MEQDGQMKGHTGSQTVCVCGWEKAVPSPSRDTAESSPGSSSVELKSKVIPGARVTIGVDLAA